MSQEVQDAYRAAFEFANSELREILEEFEKLTARKEQIEKLVAALTPIAKSAEKVELKMPVEAKDSTLDSEEQSVNSSEELEGLTPDPFQRRIDQVLGIGAGNRKFRRQF
jgi:CHASE3 domain sensor protein